MNILQISPSYYPAIKYGGPIQSVHYLNKALVSKGVDVNVITTNAGQESDFKATKLKNYKIDNGYYLIDGVRVKYMNYSGYEHYNFSIPLLLELNKIISKYDIIHIIAIWNFPVLVGGLLSILKNKPYIISPKGSIYKETIELKSYFKKKIYWSLFAKHYLNKATAIHFTTNDEEKKVINYLKIKNRSLLVPNGIDLTKIKYKKNELIKFDKEYILSLGRISKKKGFDLLIPAFSRLLKEHDLVLIIAGPDNEGYKKEVDKLIAKENIETSVIYTGLISDGKWSLYKNALMFVLPSYSENYGMSVVEAMACKTPVVISDKVGIYNEVEEAEAGVIVKTNVESLYEGMKQLIENKELRKTISINGRKLVEEKYDIEKVADQMIEQYKNIIK